MSVSLLNNFQVDGRWVCAIEVRNEHTGERAGSSFAPGHARLLAQALIAQADAAEKGRPR